MKETHENFDDGASNETKILLFAFLECIRIGF